MNILVTFSRLCLSLSCLNNSHSKVFPMHGSDRLKPNAMHGLLKLKSCHIDREVTPFQVLSVSTNLTMVVLSCFALTDCKLQYNLSLNASNQVFTAKHKPIGGRHQVFDSLGWMGGDKELESVRMWTHKAGVITLPVSKTIVGQLVGCPNVLVGVVIRREGLRSVFVSPHGLSVVISLPFSSLADLHSSKVTHCCWYSLFRHSSLHLELTCTFFSPVFFLVSQP